jgi:hypothetical protein
MHGKKNINIKATVTNCINTCHFLPSVKHIIAPVSCLLFDLLTFTFSTHCTAAYGVIQKYAFKSLFFIAMQGYIPLSHIFLPKVTKAGQDKFP